MTTRTTWTGGFLTGVLLAGLGLPCSAQTTPDAQGDQSPPAVLVSPDQPVPPPPVSPEPPPPPEPTQPPDNTSMGRGGFGGGLGGGFNPVVGQVPYRFDVRTTWFPDEPVKGQPTNLGYMEQDLSAVVPIWQNHFNEVFATANVREETFHTSAILPNTLQPFPEDLWNIRFGAGYRHLFDNDWIAGFTFGVGSASDQPFHSINEMVVNANASLRIPQGEHNAWLFTLNYSSNSEVLAGVPIPGVAYQWVPSDWFQATIGIPFASVVVRPCDKVDLSLSYALLTTVRAHATYHLTKELAFYGGFDRENESYFLADRIDDRDRFFYYDDRISCGVQWRPYRCLSVDLSSGYIFDRYYFEGHSISDSSFNRLDIGSGTFLSLRGELRF